jgi:hypothetical protein
MLGGRTAKKEDNGGDAQTDKIVNPSGSKGPFVNLSTGDVVKPVDYSINLQTGDTVEPKTDDEQTNWSADQSVKITHPDPANSVTQDWVQMDPNINNPGLADNPGRFTSQGPLLSTGKDMRKQLTGSEAPATD